MINNTLFYRKPNSNFKKLINYLFISLIFIWFSVSLISTNKSISFVSVLFAIIYFTVTELEYNFAFLVGVSVYESVFKFGNNSIWFLLLLIYLLKLILLNPNKRIKTQVLIFGVLLFIIELINDLTVVSLGQLIINLSLIIFVTVFAANADSIKYSLFDILFSLSISFMTAIFYVVKSSGGITEYINNFLDASNYALRFGHEYGETIGGAMAIPLYAALIIAFSVLILMSGIKNNIFEKVFSIVSLFIALIFGSFTISRSFYLCLAVIVIAFLFAKAKFKNKILIIICAVFFSVLTYYYFYEIANRIFKDLSLRISSDNTMTGNRSEIWKSGLKYISEHPLMLFFGKGATRYQTFAAEKGYLFSAGMHNLILDILMSWGLIGLSLVMGIVTSLLKTFCKNISKPLFLHFIPLITYFTFSLTALRTVNMKTWIFLLATFMFVKTFKNGEEEKNDT